MRKSIFERYDAIQLRDFEKAYKYNLSMGMDKSRAAGAAGIGTLYTIKQWNSNRGLAFFDDALACAGRIDAGLWMPEE